MNYDEYNYDDVELDAIEEEVEEQKLPETVSKFEKVCVSYSRYNNTPSIIGYYSILGELVKHMVEIPFGPTSIDTRVHLCQIQTARSGKTTLIKYVLLPLMEEIYKDLGDIEDTDGKKLADGKICKLTDYTTAALIGSHRENPNYIDDEDRIKTIFDDAETTIQNLFANGIITLKEMREKFRENILKRDTSKEMWLIDFGPIHGEGFWFADEFENSGVFKDRQHKEGMSVVFQHIMNNFHIGANIYEKALTGKPTIPLDSKFTILAATFVPEFLEKTVANKGVIQRFLPFIWEVPDDILTDMRKKVISKFGIIAEKRGPPLFLKKEIIEIFNLTKTQYESVGKDRLKTLNYSSHATDALTAEHKNLLDFIEDIPNKHRKIIRLFEMNLLEYMAKLAVLNCITESRLEPNRDKRFRVTATHVRQGAGVVRTCYMALVEWLENAIKQEKSSIIHKSLLKDFVRVYEKCLDTFKPQDKLEGGYIFKREFLNEAGRMIGKSRGVLYGKYKEIAFKFDEKKKGKHAYLKPKEENEE